MNRTVAWSPRVGEVWTCPGFPEVEVVGEHSEAGLVKIRGAGGESEWISLAQFERDYTQALCSECGVPLTAMRKLLVEEAKRNAPHGGGGVADGRRSATPASEGPSGFESRAAPQKAKPGTYCTKPCCWPPHAPPGC